MSNAIYVDVVVAQNASLSAAVELGSYKLVGFIAPSAIEATTTNVSFAAAPAVNGVYKVVKPDGVKKSVPFAVNDFVTITNLADLYPVQFVKLQLETAAGVAVAQATAARTFTLILSGV
jgi:hypothetical protein